eukprot:364349-Chlamydomonas_euryale.AAC.2
MLLEGEGVSGRQAYVRPRSSCGCVDPVPLVDLYVRDRRVRQTDSTSRHRCRPNTSSGGDVAVAPAVATRASQTMPGAGGSNTLFRLPAACRRLRDIQADRSRTLLRRPLRLRSEPRFAPPARALLTQAGRTPAEVQARTSAAPPPRLVPARALSSPDEVERASPSAAQGSRPLDTRRAASAKPLLQTRNRYVKQVEALIGTTRHPRHGNV